MSWVGGEQRRADLHCHSSADHGRAVGDAHGQEGDGPQAVLVLELEKKLDEAVFAGTHPVQYIGAFGKKDQMDAASGAGGGGS